MACPFVLLGEELQLFHAIALTLVIGGVYLMTPGADCGRWHQFGAMKLGRIQQNDPLRKC